MSKQNLSDFYITIACSKEAVKEKSITEIIEILKDEFRAAISIAPEAIEKFREKK